VRVVWPHHPLYLRTLPLAEFWQECGDRSYVVELPDGSTTRVPAAWTDDGTGPIVDLTPTSDRLSVAAARELATRLARLRDTCEP
jgi:hypothetical protein